MKKTPLKTHCIFTLSGEHLHQLVLRSFSHFLRRVFAENDALNV